MCYGNVNNQNRDILNFLLVSFLFQIANCLDRGLIGPQVEECLKKDFIHMRIKNERCNEVTVLQYIP